MLCIYDAFGIVICYPGDIDECQGQTCNNNGVCNDGLNTYTCSCFQGYTGSQCESKYIYNLLHTI